MALSNHVKIIVFKTSADIKKTNALARAVKEIEFWGVYLGGPWAGDTPKLCQNICRLNIYRHKKTIALA